MTGLDTDVQAETPDGADLLTIAEAAEILKVSTVTVSRWRRQGRLPTLKIGPRAVRIRRSDLDLVSQPYSGPVSSLTHPAPSPEQTTGSLTSSGSAASVGPPASGPSTVPPERTLGRALLLRATILKRRHGDFLDPAGDDLGKLRDKRAKRRNHAQ